MGTTNEFERDLEDQAGLKRPGRIDFRVLQNTADAGDGNPGVQRCFRNYMHEGGMEKDLDLVGYGIKGTSVDISNVELQQLSNIGTNTISPTQWGYVGGADQSVKVADSPTFGGLTVNGSIVVTGNVDGVDVSNLKSAFDTHKASTGEDHTYINQNLITSSSPTFVGLTLSANLVTSSTIDGVDVSAIKLNSMPSAADGNINANNQKIINVSDPTNDQDVATKAYINARTAVGCIMMFYGTWVDNSTMIGWYACTAANSGHGVPNLEDKFVRGAATSGGSGGSDDAVVVEHNHTTVNAGAHIHTINHRPVDGIADGVPFFFEDNRSAAVGTIDTNSAGIHGHTINNAGESGVGKNVPVFYELIFIMRTS